MATVLPGTNDTIFFPTISVHFTASTALFNNSESHPRTSHPFKTQNRPSNKRWGRRADDVDLQDGLETAICLQMVLMCDVSCERAGHTFSMGVRCLLKASPNRSVVAPFLAMPFAPFVASDRSCQKRIVRQSRSCLPSARFTEVTPRE